MIEAWCKICIARLWNAHAAGRRGLTRIKGYYGDGAAGAKTKEASLPSPNPH